MIEIARQFSAGLFLFLSAAPFPTAPMPRGLIANLSHFTGLLPQTRLVVKKRLCAIPDREYSAFLFLPVLGRLAGQVTPRFLCVSGHF